MNKTDIIPEEILDALLERGHNEYSIAKMTPRQMFKEYCEWHGLIGGAGNLWNYVIKLNELFDKEGNIRE